MATTNDTSAGAGGMPDLASFGTSTAPLDTTVGLLLDGYILTMVLYGFIFFQSYVYYNRYPRDHWMFKSAVAILSLMDTAAVASITESLHFYLIVQFLDTFAGVDKARPTYLADNGLATIAIFISQIGYAHRTWKLNKNLFLSLTSALFATAALALGLAMTARLSSHPSFDLLAENPGKVIMALWQALTFVAAAMSFCQLCAWQSPPNVSSEKKGWFESSLDNFVGYGIERGGIATIFQLGYFIAFISAPEKRIWVPFQLISRRLFVVSFITMLNCRHVVRGEGIYDATESIASSGPTTAQSTGRVPSRGGVVITTNVEQFAITSEFARAAASVDGGIPSGNKAPGVTFDVTTIDEQWSNGRTASKDELEEKTDRNLYHDGV